MKVNLNPIVTNINLPTVIKTAILPGDSEERLFFATQVGEIFYIGNGNAWPFLDIRSQIISLGSPRSGYDERGLLGLAFHPNFNLNGLFYLHYSVAGTQGPGALQGPFVPDPCNLETLNLTWENRENRYDHIDTVEEWSLLPNNRPEKRRTLLNLRRPFANHNGVNSLNFSPETGRLILTTGDGGSGYDPFNLSQNPMEIAGKIIEIDVDQNTSIFNPPVVTRFEELPVNIQEVLTVIAKGVRNIPGISFQNTQNEYIKYVGNVGQDLVESIFSFSDYRPIPVTDLVEAYEMQLEPDQEGLINFGWRGWEGVLPASIIRDCSETSSLEEIITAYYEDAIITSTKRIPPLISYFHDDPRPDKFDGIALTGVQPYMGNAIPQLTGNIVFTDFARSDETEMAVRGVLAYTPPQADCQLNDFHVIEVNDNFGSQSAYYVSLGTNRNQTRLFLGTNGSANVTDYNMGTIYEITPDS